MSAEQWLKQLGGEVEIQVGERADDRIVAQADMVKLVPVAVQGRDCLSLLSRDMAEVLEEP
ncbi:hypothetical protein ACO2RV_24740 [Ancylobacter sp. VNQ12]|uniref:hypothetical protein n=1 Tax=Ancylobacter sp. VNQ12 TaxID=3400920 RepID=UPI003BFF96BF